MLFPPHRLKSTINDCNNEITNNDIITVLEYSCKCICCKSLCLRDIVFQPNWFSTLVFLQRTSLRRPRASRQGTMRRMQVFSFGGMTIIQCIIWHGSETWCMPLLTIIQELGVGSNLIFHLHCRSEFWMSFWYMHHLFLSTLYLLFERSRMYMMHPIKSRFLEILLCQNMLLYLRRIKGRWWSSPDIKVGTYFPDMK